MKDMNFLPSEDANTSPVDIKFSLKYDQSVNAIFIFHSLCSAVSFAILPWNYAVRL